MRQNQLRANHSHHSMTNGGLSLHHGLQHWKPKNLGQKFIFQLGTL